VPTVRALELAKETVGWGLGAVFRLTVGQKARV